MSLYCLANFRSPEQLADMRRLDAAGVCVFCPQQLRHDPDQETILETPHWIVTTNEFPYVGTRLHLLLVPREHVIDLLDLPEPALADFWRALAQLRRRYGLQFFSLVSRNGACEYTGATVRHVHVHLIQGDVDDPEHQPVRTKLSSRPSAG